jgi:hypothetical protein
MKTNRNIITFLVALTIIATPGCELDNYDWPDSKIYGSIVDIETGELIEQDIINGAVIEYIEKGYTQIQNMVIKNDGTYRNDLMFSGKYTMTPVRGNFEPIESQIVDIKKGDNKVDFKVKPYIRIKDVNIYRGGEFVKADFTIQQTGYDNIQTLTLFAHTEPILGHTMSKGYRVDLPIGARLDKEKRYTLQMKIKSNADDNSGIFYPKPGQSWFFRVGAKINVGDSKYNYAPVQKLNF